jgi:hypothetical protein
MREGAREKVTTVLMLAGFFLLLCSSCTEKSTGPEDLAPGSFSAQSSKCLATALSKTASADSIFTYTFTDQLVVDFSVHGNCCPDSNRFQVTHTESFDTLTIAVTDTARNLCRCICPYMIHAAYGALSNDNYMLRCVLKDMQGNEALIHLVRLSRTK